jgi:hypothetical protein
MGFFKVESLAHSSSLESFVKVTMVPALAGSFLAKHDITATLHHTFPTCGGGAAQAMDLKPGDCLHTTEGKGFVESLARVPVKKAM